MAMRDAQSLSAISGMIMPGVDAVVGRAAAENIPIRDAKVWMDFAKDEVQLVVTHALISRRDADYDTWRSDIGPRLQSAMRLFHRMPAAKALCVDRRRLNARGEKVRKEANRPVIHKSKKRHRA